MFSATQVKEKKVYDNEDLSKGSLFASWIKRFKKLGRKRTEKEEDERENLKGFKATMVQNSLISLHLITHFLASSRVSE